MATATPRRSFLKPEPPPGSGPWLWIIVIAGVAGAAMIAGGFLLPKHIEWPTTIAVAGSDDMSVPVSEVISPTPTIPVPPPKPTRLLPNLDDPTTPMRRPDGPAYQLAADIDQLIDEKLVAANTVASALASDAEFLRRVSLDLTGKVPTYERVISFLADVDPLKRAKLVDELLDHADYGRHLAHGWADLLVKRDPDANRNLKPEAFVAWLAKQFNDNRKWDAIVTDLVTATGKPEDTPQAFFFLANQDNNQPSPPKLVGTSVNLFLGIQAQCCECHVHPTVASWTQHDFWGLAAFFGHTKFDRDGKAGKAAVAGLSEVRSQPQPKGKAAQKQGEKAIAAGDTIRIPDPTDAKKTAGTARAKYFEGRVANLANDFPLRPKFAVWLTGTDNKYFARAFANRLWGHFFARGIVHPIEDMGPNSTPTHPELLDRVAAEFTNQRFDIKFLIRAYCNSNAYQRTSKPTAANESDETLLSHMRVKVIGAREMLESLALVTSAPAPRGPDRVQGKGNAKGIAAPATGIKFFDRREYEDDPTEFNYGIPQLLKQMNTGYTNNLDNAVSRFAKSGASRDDVIVDLTLAALGRRPRVPEIEKLSDYVARRSDPNRGYRDVLWALLNSAEFLSNH